jgi:FAD/FMN-containing dehydrogenase
LIYGTVRCTEQDKESFHAWAKKRYACVIFSPHTSGETQALRKTGEVCRQIIRAANKRGGSFYLTYNRFATRDELASAYPQFPDFLNFKKQHDPREIFQSDWYKYYKGLYA